MKCEHGWTKEETSFLILTLKILKMFCGCSHDISNTVHSLQGLRPALYNRHTRVGYSLSIFHLKTQVDQPLKHCGDFAEVVDSVQNFSYGSLFPVLTT
jgi:hypothetical protein